MSVNVIAIISPKAGKEDRVQEGLQQLAQNVKDHESGALMYQVYQQTGDAGAPNDFVVVEEYTDQAAYENHSATDYFKELVAAIQKEDLLAKPLEIKIVKKFAGFFSR